MPKTTQKLKTTGRVRAAKAKKGSVWQSAPVSTAEPRVLPPHKRVWNKPRTWLPPRLPAPPRKPLPKARVIAMNAWQRLWRNKRLFGGIIIIYGIIDILLIRGFSSTVDLTDFKAAIDSLAAGTWNHVIGTVGSFLYLLVNSGATTGSSSYTSIVLLIMSLAFIWGLRQVTAGNQPRIRDSFYEGMYPLIPFLLVLFVVSFQLLPVGVGGFLYNFMISHGIAIDLGEKAIWVAVFVALAIWSLYMITSTLFALYIVTLPNMTPMKALRSARQLVYRRRLLIWLKLLYLPLVLFVIAAVVEIPLIMIWPLGAEWMFFVLSMASLAAVHSYLYALYRELL